MGVRTYWESKEESILSTQAPFYSMKTMNVFRKLVILFSLFTISSFTVGSTATVSQANTLTRANPVAADGGIVGNWLGVIPTPGGEHDSVRVLLNIAKAENGTIGGDVISLDQNSSVSR